MYNQEVQARSIEIQYFAQWAFYLANFFKYLVRESWRGGGELLLKNGTINDYAYWQCYFWAGFTSRGLLAL